MGSAERQRFEADVRARLDSLAELCMELIRTPSENPPGDTSELATLIDEAAKLTDGSLLCYFSLMRPVNSLITPDRSLIPLRKFPVNFLAAPRSLSQKCPSRRHF